MTASTQDARPTTSGAAGSSGAGAVGTTLTQQVYEAVRARILGGEFEPGAFVREAEVGHALGVSRTPVREALNRLASEGFVERLAHRGFRVPEQSIEDLVHLYPVLRALDVLAGELAFPRLTEADLLELEEANRRFAAALAANDVARAIQCNDDFHHRLGRMSGNPILCSLMDDLRMQVRRLEVWDFSHALLEADGRDGSATRDEWLRQHEGILSAARRRDYAAALNHLRENRSFVFEEAMRSVVEHGRGTEGGK